MHTKQFAVIEEHCDEMEDIFSKIEDMKTKKTKKTHVSPVVYVQNSIYAKDRNEFIIQSAQRYGSKLDNLPYNVSEAVKELQSKQNSTLQFFLLQLRPLFQTSFKAESFHAILINQFCNLPLYAGDHVKVFGYFDDHNNVIVIQRYDETKNNNYILFDPSVLVSPSQLNGVSFCERQQVLKGFFRPIESDVSAPQVIGLGGHELFEYYLKNDHHLIMRDKFLLEGSLTKIRKQPNIDISNELPTWVREKLYEVYKGQFVNAYLLQLTYPQYLEHMSPILIQSLLWICKHIHQKEPIPITQKKNSCYIRILEVIEIEKYLETYEYGFCGILDSLLRCEILQDGKAPVISLVPLELKTGKKQMQSYRMQSLIYSMLVQQNYTACRVDYSLLLYIYDNQCQVVETNMLDWQHIVFQRNFIAQSTRSARKDAYLLQLPALLNDTRSCNNCFMNDICSTVAIINNADIEDVSSDFKIFQEVKGKLQEESIEFIKDQLYILYEEESAQVVQMNKESQNFQSSNALPLFKWFESQYIDQQPKRSQSHQSFEFSLSSVSYNSTSLVVVKNTYNEGDKVILIANDLKLKLDCTITNIKIRDASPIIIDDDMYETSASQQDDMSYNLILEVNITNKQSNSDDLYTYEELKKKKLSTQPIQWIIRKRDFNPFLQYRTSVVALVTNEKYARLKDILIAGLHPKYANKLSERQCEALSHLDTYKKNLNIDQFLAIKMVLEAEDFHIVQGFPGTGKTYLIAHLLLVLALCRFKVLIVTYTHSALDNLIGVFQSLFADQIRNCLRFCSDKSKVSQEAQRILFRADEFDEIAQLGEFLTNKYLFFTTCLSSQDKLLKTIKFDYCVVDEASQIIEPLCLTNILMAPKFVLIGDPNQLQPLVKSQKVKKQLSQSLLERLSNKFPDACSCLTLQYRMNDEIMRISNILVYDNQLQIGNDKLRTRSLQLSSPNTRGNRVLMRVFDPQASVIFLNYTQNVLEQFKNDYKIKQSKKKFPGQSVDILQIEADIVYLIAKSMLDAGLKSADLAIITTFNKSATCIQKRFKGGSFVQIMTIDRSQGIDKECVIVVCSGMNHTNQLMNDWRRINVAFTRAKSKLIIVGSLEYLQTLGNFKAFCNLLINYKEDLDVSFIKLVKEQD